MSRHVPSVETVVTCDYCKTSCKESNWTGGNLSLANPGIPRYTEEFEICEYCLNELRDKLK